jgi:membrane-associated phospholipid phosphatase
MLEAAALSSAAAYVLKQAAGRERPYVAGDPDHWRSGGDAFPSLHVTAAFAIGTVLAESGNERHRWIRRVLGYGIAAGTAYQRIDHDAHWFSDAVAGAGLGLATARFVMQRRESSSARTQVRLVPSERGLALTYAVALRQ